ncbi:MAG: hypothetical protein WC289_01320 [Patescibacteria group bacterium]|jgi:hypothetical protein
MSPESFEDRPIPEQQREYRPAVGQSKSIVLPIDRGILRLPEEATREIGGKSFDQKKEFHVTLIGNKRAKILRDHLAVHPEDEQKIRDILEQIVWSYALSDSAMHIQQDKMVSRQLSRAEKKAPDTIEETVHRESVIQRADIPGLAVLYQRMRDELGIDLGDPPPAHVTLYTHNDKSGIGIDSEQDLESMNPQPVDIPRISEES